MKEYKLSPSELRFAELIWDNEPIGSGDLVKLCAKEMDWKKSTTYTVLKNLCDKGILKNQDSLVTSQVTKEDFKSKQSKIFVEDTFGGSLPKFLAAFISGKSLSNHQAEELKRLIDEHKEG